HARARPPRVEEDLEDERRHVDAGLRHGSEERPRRAVGLRAVADGSQVGVHPHGGLVLRRRAAEHRAQARGLGLAELGRNRHRRGSPREARAEQRRRGRARGAELVPHEVAAHAGCRRRGIRGNRAVHPGERALGSEGARDHQGVRAMSLRRIFLLGAATIVSIAALVAIAAIVNGDFGDTEGKIFATLATAFVAGSTAIVGIACLERGVSRPFAVLGVLLATFGFLLWADQIWDQHDSGGYWKLLGLLLAWALATPAGTTTRLMTRSQRVERTLFRATAAAAVGAGLTVSTMILRENGDGWQLFAVLLVLALLGEALTPIVERYSAATSDQAPRERVLGGDRRGRRPRRAGAPGRRIDPSRRPEIPIADDARIVVRPG